MKILSPAAGSSIPITPIPYSFEPNDSAAHFSDQQTLLNYFRRVADTYGIRQGIRFNTEVDQAVFDEA